MSQADYCKRACDKAVACGNQTALAQKGLEAEAKSAIEKNAPTATQECNDACTKETASDARLDLSERCNQEKDCAAFARCIGDLAKEFKK